MSTIKSENKHNNTKEEQNMIEGLSNIINLFENVKDVEDYEYVERENFIEEDIEKQSIFLNHPKYISKEKLNNPLGCYINVFNGTYIICKIIFDNNKVTVVPNNLILPSKNEATNEPIIFDYEGFFRGYAPDELYDKNWNGNSVLVLMRSSLEEKQFYYRIFYNDSEGTFDFITTEPIKKFYALMENNWCNYPVAVSKNFTYYLKDKKMINRKVSEDQIIEGYFLMYYWDNKYKTTDMNIL